MALGYILQQCGKKMGLNPSNPGSRTVLLRYANEAARELYMQADIEGSLMEAVFRVNGDQTISLPVYVGFVRAIRELATQQSWHINQMRPRYNQYNWKDVWKGWRLRNRQALMTTISNQSVCVITTPEVENPPVVITITGSTNLAANITETIVLSSTAVETVNQYLDIFLFEKDRPNNYDISLVDVDNKLLSVIPNNELDSEYQIVDVSQAPWLSQVQSPFDNYMEVLYKQTLKYMFNDGDKYPCPNCDDAIVNKMLQLWNEEQNKADVAAAYDTKATRTIARLQEESNRATEDEISLASNPHDTMIGRIGIGARRRYSYYTGHRY